MENFLFSVNAVAPLFVLMTLGYIVRQTNIISESFIFEANKFVFKLLLPLMLFQNIRSTFHGEIPNGKLIIAAIIGTTIVITLSILIVPLFIQGRGRRGSMIQGIYRSNFLIYGMPLAMGMYGNEAAQSIAVLMGFVIPFYNVSAVIILTIYSEDNLSLKIIDIIKGIFTNPLILGCIIGIFFGYFNIQIPTLINRPISELAAAASPLALFLTGADFRFKSVKNNIWLVLSATFARLILVPVLALFVFILIGFRGLDLSVLLCIFATPASVSSYIMAKSMGNDGELSGQIVVVSTVASSITIFLLIYVLRSLGYL